MSAQATFYGQPFPSVVDHGEVGTASTETWVRDNAAQFDVRVSECGVIVFRGFPLETDHDFDAFIRAFGFPNFPYDDSLSNAVRMNRTDRVFTANEAPPDVAIYLHHEMAQTPLYPSKLFFFCEMAPERGGATAVCRSDALFENLVEECPAFAKDCETKGLRYTNVMPSGNDPGSGMGRSWRCTLNADSRDAAEKRLTRLGYVWEWLDDDCLRATTPVLPAVRKLASGRKAFFNQLIAAFKGWKDSRNDPSKSITFGDGSRLDTASANRAAELAEKLSVDLHWQRGDVALVDNFVAMHGRRSFEGTRKVLASLVA